MTSGSPVPAGTVLPGSPGEGISPPGSTDLSLTPLIPVTGEEVASLQCQFCVDDEAHALLVLPDVAYFDVITSAPVRCLTADVVNGRRILICRGAPSTSFNLNVCSDSTNCLQFPVTFQDCLPPTALPYVPGLPGGSPNSSNNQNPGRPDDTGAPPAPAATSQPPTDQPPPAPTQGSGQEAGEVVICHMAPGNPDNRKTMTVGQSAWENEHKKHGDSLGPCP